jgi:hypothetical protein
MPSPGGGQVRGDTTGHGDGYPVEDHLSRQSQGFDDIARTRGGPVDRQAGPHLYTTPPSWWVRPELNRLFVLKAVKKVKCTPRRPHFDLRASHRTLVACLGER